MRLIRIGLSSVNTTVGAFTANTDKLIRAGALLAEAGCTIVHGQEQGIGGYPSEDLVQWGSFLTKQWAQLLRFAQATSLYRSVFTVSLMVGHRGNIYNCIATVFGGKMLGLAPKENLPTYGIFHEGRTCSPWPAGVAETHESGVPIGDLIYEFPFGVVETETCEDIWVPDGPMLRRSYAGAEVALNSSSSPFRAGVVGTRVEMISTRASDNACIVAYANQVGGNGALVFDGGGYVCDNGRMRHVAQRKVEQTSFCDVDLARVTRMRNENTTWRNCARRFMTGEGSLKPARITCDGPSANDTRFRYPVPANKSFFIPARPAGPQLTPAQEYFDDLIDIMTIGLGDYFDKTGAFKRIGIALSGGKDSYLAAVIAWLVGKARGWTEVEMRDRIRCYSMPTRHNSGTTKSIAHDVCEELSLGFKEVSIQEEYEFMLARHPQGLDEGQVPGRATKQNFQARIRGLKMMQWSNDLGLLWIQTGNMSEKAVGYTTYGGDMMGALALISNAPKTVVIGILGRIFERFSLDSCRRLLETKASAELEDDQEDEKDLMPFPVLDACFALFVGEKMTIEEVKQVLGTMWTGDELRQMEPRYRDGLMTEWVDRFARLFRQSIWKWVQTPEGIHLGSLDLDRERALQLPVVQSGEWME